MTKLSPAPAVSAPDQTAQALRLELRELLRTRRLSAEPRLTQLALSQALGYTYAVVTGWENGSRQFYPAGVRAWAGALGFDAAEVEALLARYADALPADEQALPATGSRVDLEVNARCRALRKQRGLSMREFCELTGLSMGHWQRIELDASNLSVAQVRKVATRLRITYEWLIDGAGEPSREILQQTIARLTRENELLESFRRQAERNTR